MDQTTKETEDLVKLILARTLSPHAWRVKAFMQKAGQKLPRRPTVPNGKIRELRVRLLMEEALEFAKASGVRIETTFGEKLNSIDDLHFQVTDQVDLVEVADGLADVSVVTVGAMLAYGIADEGLLRAVDANNLAKFGPGGYKDEHGKWQKPPDHKPPDVAGILRLQGWGDNEQASTGTA
jgi:predicted HAD superfamily Cof-like phosphohydrolase